MAIISKSKKLCFVHVIRTGGTTVRNVLNKQIGDFSIIIGNEHGTIKECIELMPEVMDYYKFSYVRQPYDWLLSLYYYIKMPSSNHPDLKIIEKLDFYDFLIWIQDVGMKRDLDCRLPIYRTQSQCLFVNNNFMMDDIYKFEELCDDVDMSNLRSIFAKFDLKQTNKIPVLNKSDRPLSYIDSFSIKEIKLVNKLFAEDFKNFKYFKYE